MTEVSGGVSGELSGGAVFDGDGAVLLPSGAVFSVKEQHRASFGERRAMYRAMVGAAADSGAGRPVMRRVRWFSIKVVLCWGCQAAYWSPDDAPQRQ